MIQILRIRNRKDISVVISGIKAANRQIREARRTKTSLHKLGFIFRGKTAVVAASARRTDRTFAPPCWDWIGLDERRMNEENDGRNTLSKGGERDFLESLWGNKTMPTVVVMLLLSSSNRQDVQCFLLPWYNHGNLSPSLSLSLEQTKA